MCPRPVRFVEGLRRSDLVAMHESGMSARDIAATLNVSRWVVSHLIEGAGGRLRTSGEGFDNYWTLRRLADADTEATRCLWQNCTDACTDGIRLCVGCRARLDEMSGWQCAWPACEERVMFAGSLPALCYGHEAKLSGRLS